MVDIWYTFGAMVADPGFLRAIAGLNPVFTLINMTVTENGGAPITRKSAGFLDENSTTLVRRTMRNYAGAKLTQPVPVISLFTAGKVIQLLATLRVFPNVFSLANMAFVAAGGLPTASAAMLTAMGSNLLDTQLAVAFRDSAGPLPGDNVPLSTEFGLQASEVATLQTWLKDSNFITAQATLFTADCWKDNTPCLEEFVFYEGFKRAVN
jgi:hypothetical protein